MSFAFDGATFANSDGKVTFEQMNAKFNHDKNPALARIGSLIHSLDAHSNKAPGKAQ